MTAKSWIKISLGGFGLYIVLAILCAMCEQRDHALMFLIGSILWIGCAGIWAMVHQVEK